MKNNIKKAPVKFWEDLLYFQHFMQIFFFCSKLVIITTLRLAGLLFWVSRPFETVFQSISGRLPERGRKRRGRIDESKMSKQLPPAPTARALGPCPTIIQIIGRPVTGSLPRTIAPPDNPSYVKEDAFHAESSDTPSTTKSSGGNRTKGSVRGEGGGVDEVTHRCE